MPHRSFTATSSGHSSTGAGLNFWRRVQDSSATPVRNDPKVDSAQHVRGGWVVVGEFQSQVGQADVVQRRVADQSIFFDLS